MADGVEGVRKSPRKNYCPVRMIRTEKPAAVEVQIKEEPPDEYETVAGQPAAVTLPGCSPDKTVSSNSATKTHHKKHKKRKSPKEKHRRHSKSGTPSEIEDPAKVAVVGEKRICPKVAKRAKHHSKSKGHDSSPHGEVKSHKKCKHRTGESSVDTTPKDGSSKKSSKKRKRKSGMDKSEKHHKKHKRKSLDVSLEKSVKQMVGDIESRCPSAGTSQVSGGSVRTGPTSSVPGQTVTDSCSQSDNREISSTTVIDAAAANKTECRPTESHSQLDLQSATSKQCDSHGSSLQVCTSVASEGHRTEASASTKTAEQTDTNKTKTVMLSSESGSIAKELVSVQAGASGKRRHKPLRTCDSSEPVLSDACVNADGGSESVSRADAAKDSTGRPAPLMPAQTVPSRDEGRCEVEAGEGVGEGANTAASSLEISSVDSSVDGLEGPKHVSTPKRSTQILPSGGDAQSQNCVRPLVPVELLSQMEDSVSNSTSDRTSLDDLFKLTAELSALNKDSERLTTPIHNKYNRTFKFSPHKTPKKTPSKSPARSPYRYRMFGSASPLRHVHKSPHSIAKGLQSAPNKSFSGFSRLPSRSGKSPAKVRLFKEKFLPSTQSGSKTDVAGKSNDEKTVAAPTVVACATSTSEPVSGTSTAGEITSQTTECSPASPSDESKNESGIEPMSPHTPVKSPPPAATSTHDTPSKQKVATPTQLSHTPAKSPSRVRFNLSEHIDRENEKLNKSGKPGKSLLKSPGRVFPTFNEKPAVSGGTSQGGLKVAMEIASPDGSDEEIITTRAGNDKSKIISLRAKRKSDAVETSSERKRRKLERKKRRTQSVKRRLSMDVIGPGDTSVENADSSSSHGPPLSGTKPSTSVRPTPSPGSESSSSQNDSDEEPLTIAEGELELDRVLSSKQQTKDFRLTATNVKNILKQVITNEAVMDMVRNSIQEEGIAKDLKEAIFEPKMTRTRVKKVLEQEGTLPAWPLSPVKFNRQAKSVPAFIEMAFNEESEDEDYDPAKEPPPDSCDDESIVSSMASDRGSPMTPSLLSPCVSYGDCSPKQLFKDETRAVLCRESPASSQPATLSAAQEDIATIALRTRSKLPLTDTSLGELEANFVAPDITPDMYDTDLDDNPDWFNFLTGLTKEDEFNDTRDDEQNDPEFNFLEAVETETEDGREETQFDRATRITKRELNELMDALEEIADLQDSSDPHTDPIELRVATSLVAKETYQTPKLPKQAKKCVPPPPPPPAKMVPHMMPEEYIQLEDQMRKHTQLLAQTYVLASADPVFRPTMEFGKNMILELKELGDKSQLPDNHESAFHPLNLGEALQVVQWQHPPKNLALEETVNKRIVKFLRKSGYVSQDMVHPTPEMMEIFLSNKAFMFAQMIPECQFATAEVCSKMKVNFTNSEDNLIVMGMDQFRDVGRFSSSVAPLINQYMLPCKSVSQIMSRVKTLTSVRSTTNVVKNYKKDRTVPKWPRYLQLESADQVLPARYRAKAELPYWFVPYEEVRIANEQGGVLGESATFCRSQSALQKSEQPAQQGGDDGHEEMSDAMLDDMMETPSYQPPAPQKKSPLKSSPVKQPARPVRRKPRPSRTKPKVSNALNMPLVMPPTIVQTPMVIPGTNQLVMLPVVTSGMTPPVLPVGQSTMVPAGGSVAPLPPGTIIPGPLPPPTQNLLEMVPHTKDDGTPGFILKSVNAAPSSLGAEVTASSSVSSTVVSGSEDDCAVTTDIPDASPSKSMKNIIHAAWSLSDETTDTQMSKFFSNPSIAGLLDEKASTDDAAANQETANDASDGTQRRFFSMPSEESLFPTQEDAAAVKIDTDTEASSASRTSVALTVPASSSANVTGDDTVDSSLMESPLAHSSAVDVCLSTDTGLSRTASDAETSVPLVQPDNVASSSEHSGSPPPHSATTTQAVMDGSCPSTTVGSSQPAAAPSAPACTSTQSAFTSPPHVSNHASLTSPRACSSVQSVLLSPPRVTSHASLMSPPTIMSPSSMSASTSTSASASHIPVIPSSPFVSLNSPSNSQSAPAPKTPSKMTVVTSHLPALGNITAFSSSLSSHSPFLDSGGDDIDAMNTSLCLEPVEDLESSQASPIKERDLQSVLMTPAKIVPIDDDDSYPSPLLERPFRHRTPKKPAETPTKQAVAIMASLATALTTPPKRSLFVTSDMQSDSQDPVALEASPEKLEESPNQNDTFKTPTKKPPGSNSSDSPRTPSKYRTILPKPGFSSPSKPALSPLLPKISKSPRRKILHQQVRKILPKGYFVSALDVSPTKKAAATIKAKARRGRPPYRKNTARLSPEPRLKAAVAENEPSAADRDASSDYDSLPSDDSDDKENMADQEPTKKQKRRVRDDEKKRGLRRDEDAGQVDDSGSDVADSGADEDDEDLAALMAASTTVRFAPKAAQEDADMGKVSRKRRGMARMLAPNLVESDTLRDERDTAFAQSYLNKVKETLSDRIDLYNQFLSLLFDFNKKEKTSIELYQEVRALLAAYPELVQNFAPFLLPEEARQCQCQHDYEEFSKARNFLRKVEVYFGQQSQFVQRIFRAFSQIQSKDNPSPYELFDAISPLLKGQQHLTDEFNTFFAKERPAESFLTDFEEVVLHSDSDNDQPNDYEEVEISDSEEELNGTIRCKCSCHDSKDPRYQRRRRHCIPCGMKIIKGKMYVQVSEKNLRPLLVRYHNPEAHQTIRPSAADDDSNQGDWRLRAIDLDDDDDDDSCETYRVVKHYKKRRRLKKRVKNEPSGAPSTSHGSPRDVSAEGGAVVKSEPRIIKLEMDVGSEVVGADCTAPESEQASANGPEVNAADTTSHVVTAESSAAAPAPAAAAAAGHEGNESDLNASEDGDDDDDDEDYDDNPLGWTRDEDAHILECCKQADEPDNVTFEKIAQSLENRTVQQVEQRFRDLMQLWADMTDTESDEEGDIENGDDGDDDGDGDGDEEDDDEEDEVAIETEDEELLEDEDGEEKPPTES